jgi:aspartate racemase
MITETASWAANEWTHIHKFGLLATTGTYKSQIYHSVFEQHGLEIIIPDTPFIRKTMDAISGIKGIKAGFREAPRSALMETIEHLAGKGVEAIVSGCTEVSLILNQELMNMPFLDPVTILARKSITFAGYELKEPESYAAD